MARLERIAVINWVLLMEERVTNGRNEESTEAKARWFQSLSLVERMDYLCAVTDLVFQTNPQIARKKHVESITGRVRVLTLP